MIHEEITLAGKPVTLGYCYATEIAYKDLSGEDIAAVIKETFAAVNAKPQRMPDTKRSIYPVLAAVMAYYQSKDEDAPIKDTDLMNEPLRSNSARPSAPSSPSGRSSTTSQRANPKTNRRKERARKKTNHRPRHLPTARGRDRNPPP